MWRMLFDIVRFNVFALDILRNKHTAHKDDLSVGQYLDEEGYSAYFRDNYLIPMTAAIWSTSPDQCFLEFPILTLVLFMYDPRYPSTVALMLTGPGGTTT